MSCSACASFFAISIASPYSSLKSGLPALPACWRYSSTGMSVIPAPLNRFVSLMITLNAGKSRPIAKVGVDDIVRIVPARNSCSISSRCCASSPEW